MPLSVQYSLISHVRLVAKGSCPEVPGKHSPHCVKCPCYLNYHYWVLLPTWGLFGSSSIKNDTWLAAQPLLLSLTFDNLETALFSGPKLFEITLQSKFKFRVPAHDPGLGEMPALWLNKHAAWTEYRRQQNNTAALNFMFCVIIMRGEALKSADSQFSFKFLLEN